MNDIAERLARRIEQSFDSTPHNVIAQLGAIVFGNNDPDVIALSQQPPTPGQCGHHLDVHTVKGVPDFDGPDGSVVIEVHCKECGQSGSLRILPSEVGFDLD